MPLISIKYNILLVFTIYLFSGMSMASPLLLLEKFEHSMTQWQKIRQQINGNYAYEIHHSNFSGTLSKTTIIIKNNNVVERRFKSADTNPKAIDDTKPKPTNIAWREVGDELGRSNNAAPVRTMEQLYEKAREIVTLELQPYERRYIQYDSLGVLKYSYIIDTRIADDTPVDGVIIAKLILATPPKIEPCGANINPFPTHWGAEPSFQTRDNIRLPAGFGCGSSTLSDWIKKNLKKDKKGSQ